MQCPIDRHFLRKGTWRTYDGTNGLPAPACSLYQDRNGYLWVGHPGNQISRFDGEVFRVFGAEEGFEGRFLNGFAQTADGTLWCATQDGLARFIGEAFRTFTPHDGLPHMQVNALALDPDGSLWCATQDGLARYEGGRFDCFTTGDGLPHPQVNALAFGDDGALWCATQDGLARYDGQTFRIFATDDGLPHMQINVLLADLQGRPWLGTEGGLSCYADDRFVNFSTHDGLVHDQIIALYQGRGGDLWIGTYSGLSHFSRDFVSLDATDGLPNDNLRALHQDRQGHLWLGTEGGLSRLDENGFKNYSQKDGLVHDRVYAIHEDADGVLWLGTLGGLSRFDRKAFKNYTQKDGLVHDWVYCICPDADGVLWLGTLDGLSCFDGKTFKNYTQKDGLVHNDVTAIAVGPDGVLWLGTEGGLSRFDGNEFKNYTAKDGLVFDNVWDLAFDEQGHLWIATLGGLSRFDGESFRNFTAKDGLASPQVLRLLRDRLGYLWCSTWSGLQRYDGEVFQTVNRRDGLAGNIPMALLEDDNGRLWAGTSHGVTCFCPSQTTPPPVFIRAVVADRRYEECSDCPALEVPASDGLTAFEFHAVSFKTRPGSMVYRYRLEGHDPNWRTTNARRVEYADLKPGHYVFQVLAVDRDLTYSMPARIQLVVLPDARDERIDALEERVQQRTRELSQKNDALEAALTRLQETQDQLIVQERMAALGNMIAGIAHELNSPLGAVRSAADVSARAVERLEGLLPAPERAAKLQRLLDVLRGNGRTIDQATERLHRIVQSLKNFIRLDEADFQKTDVHEGLESSLTLLEYQFKGRIDVVRDYGDLPPIYCYPNELNQVFMHVLLNAVQAISGQGRISVRTYGEGANVYIQIADSGRGIPAERLPHIFEPGFSNKDRRVGLGLGLSTSYHIVRNRHQGFIKLESQIDKGTVVTIVLPVQDKS